MAQPYSLKSLVNLIVNENHDAASAAALFDKKTDYIQRVQRSPEYQNLLQSARNRRSSQTRTTIIKIADDEIATAPRPARVDNVDSTVLVLNKQTTILKRYEQGNPLRDTFVFKNFATAQDREDDNELPVSERPTNVSFDPLTPVQLKGTHIVSVTFTPQRQGTAIAELYLE